MNNKIAVIKSGGKQYKVKTGDKIKIEKIEGEKGKIQFDTLMVASSDGKELDLGQPLTKNKVEGKISGQGRNKKVNVVKYKNKTRYLRNLGHKQPFTEVEITKIA